jgi:hypothetical protein
VQSKPPRDIAKKRVTTPKGKKHGNDDTRKERNAGSTGKGASSETPQRARISEDRGNP